MFQYCMVWRNHYVDVHARRLATVAKQMSDVIPEMFKLLQSCLHRAAARRRGSILVVQADFQQDMAVGICRAESPSSFPGVCLWSKRRCSGWTARRRR